MRALNCWNLLAGHRRIIICIWWFASFANPAATCISDITIQMKLQERLRIIPLDFAQFPDYFRNRQGNSQAEFRMDSTCAPGTSSILFTQAPTEFARHTRRDFGTPAILKGQVLINLVNRWWQMAAPSLMYSKANLAQGV